MSGRETNPRDAAHRYADHGWKVFPVRPGEKLPLIPSAHREGEPPCTGECGREGHGFHDATTDPATIDRWWRRAPEANVGIATGAPGPDVVDVDLKPGGKSGYSAWNEAKAAGLVDGAQAHIRTPSGGLHAYYGGTGQRSASCKSRAIDFRSTGGYVVAPPSWSGEHGRGYEVLQHQASDATVDWAAVRELVDPQPERKAPEHYQPGRRPASLDHLPRYVSGLEEGGRGDGMFWALCRAAEAGDEATLAAVADAGRGVGLTDREVAASVRSARRTVQAQAAPRPLEREREAGS